MTQPFALVGGQIDRYGLNTTDPPHGWSVSDADMEEKGRRRSDLTPPQSNKSTDPDWSGQP